MLPYRVTAIALVIAAAVPLAGQTPPPTARDSTFAAPALRLTDLIDKETHRAGSMRKTQTRAWNDTLTRLINALVTAPTPAPNAAPVARFTIPPTGCTAGQICTFDASISTDDKGITGYTWDCGTTPNCSSTGKTASVVYAAPGTMTVSLTVRDAEGLTNAMARQVTVTQLPLPDSQPPVDTGQGIALPKAIPNPTFAKATRTIAAQAFASDLQAILNAAQPGDSITISGDFSNITLPNKPCGAGISITTAAPALATGARQTPTTKTGRIITTTSAPALRVASPTCQWRIDGIEIVATTPGTTLNYAMVAIGDGNGASSGGTQNSLDKVPQQLIFSHVYIHGLAATNSTRCVSLQSGNTIIRDSWISDCHAKGFDSQAICGWNGPGPYLIENNYLEAAGENVMFGGAAPLIPGLRPTDLTIRLNHFVKYGSWQGVWTVKNLFELKAAYRVLLARNVFQLIWPSGQEGFAVVIKSNQGDETNPVSLPYGTTDVTIEGNLIDSAAVGIDIHAKDCYPTCPSITTGRVLVRGNLIRHVMRTYPFPTSANGRAAQMLLTGTLYDIAVTGNSFYHDTSIKTSTGSAITMDGGLGAARRLTFTNNYFEGGAYQVFYSGGKVGSAAFDSMAGPGNWTFSGNALVYGTASRYPAGNTFPAASTVTSGVGADVTAVLNGVAGVVVPPPPQFRRAARRRPRAIATPRLTSADSARLRGDPSNPWLPSTQAAQQLPKMWR